jgi:hypothetical protein
MSEKRLYYSLFIRSAGYISLLFFSWCLAASFLNLMHYKNETHKLYGIIIFGLAMLPVLILNLKLHMSLLFAETSFSIKYPFCPEQIIKYEDLNGWAISSGKLTKVLNVYYKENRLDKKIRISISGKQLGSELTTLIKQQYASVMRKNISKIKTDGFEIQLSLNKTLTIKEDCIVITEPIRSRKLRWKELQDLSIKTNGMFIRFTLLFEHDIKLVFTNYMCQGGIGLTEFFNRKSKELSKRLAKTK